ncbi:MAG TPA: M56 family metallopeptidase [Rhodanobacteraceae bacterium]|nr:M56 family metallopeptidase [Rhodanobacteraceae bacterium]
MSASEPAVLVVQALGWGLLHFLWQGLLAGAIYAVVRPVLPRGNPRYIAAMVALLALAVLPVATGWHEARILFTQPADLGNMMVAGGPGAVPAAAAAASGGWFAPLRDALPWLVLAWGCGVLFLVGRVFRQWLGLRAIVRAAERLPAWQDRAQRLGGSLGLQHAIRVLVSARIATPTLVGWVRPVVVVPLALLTRMPAEQVDLVLVHELAHLRRLDHLANLFQVAVETLLFYHPVVHWISRDARNERELCCDALALEATGGKRRDFVAALAGLAEFHTSHADLALAASGGLLVERAWFIAGKVPERRRGHASFMVTGLALLGVAVALALAWRQDLVRQQVEQVLATNAVVLQRSLDGIPDRGVPMAYRVPEWRPNLVSVSLAKISASQTLALVSGVSRVVTGSPSLLSVPDIEAARWRPSRVAVNPREGDNQTPPASVATAPRAIHTVAPAYPARALLNGVQGRVEIRFALSANGAPEDLRVVDSSASGQLDAAALAALSRWRFAPPAAAGRQYRQSFTFRLDGGTGAADAAVAKDCLPSTGTHICRHVFDTGVKVMQSSH